MSLNHRERAFIEHYIRRFNASAATRLAGYSEHAAGAIGHKLLKKAEIKAAVEARLAELAASPAEILRALTDHARGSMEDFVRIGEAGTAQLDLARAQTLQQLHLVKKLRSKTITRRSADGDGTEVEVTNEVELYDAQAALVTLGRHHGLWLDKAEISDPAAGQVDSAIAKLEQLLSRSDRSAAAEADGRDTPPVAGDADAS